MRLAIVRSWSAISGHRNLILTFAALTASIAMLGVSNPESWVRSGLQVAVKDSSAITYGRIASREPGTPPVVGSESFWLNDATAGQPNTNKLIQPATWSPAVAIGDRFTLSSKGMKQVYEIVALQPVALTGTTAQTSQGAVSSQLLVICQSVKSDQIKTLKVLIDRDQGLPWRLTPSRAAHAL